MKNLIRNLKIANFKSIREAELECGRINLFVGKPNVGKSNVLEALALSAWHFSNNDEKFMGEFVRYEKLSNLLFYQDFQKVVQVETPLWKYSFGLDIGSNLYAYSHSRPMLPNEKTETQKLEENMETLIRLDAKGKFVKGEFSGDFGSAVKKYKFKENWDITQYGRAYLNPPFGDNLFWILQTTKQLKDAIPDMFAEYGLEFLIDLEENKFAVQRRENGISYKVPYNLIADTLQRIIFHYAAIFSNKDSVILFEEPESHSYPPYISDLAYKIIDNKENQFFITTHSPYLFDTLVENTPTAELAVFVTYFENYETKFKKLTDEELTDLMSYGTDIFFNLKWFVNE